MLCECGFAHTCKTDSGRRSWLQGLVNLAKRYVIHAAAYNRGLIPRKLFGVGTPRSLQGRAVAACAALPAILRALYHRLTTRATGPRPLNPIPTPITPTLSRLPAA